ncbi:CYTH domain-containing protein [Lentisphaerota bacterium ZTH]|nr:CYTH domain-containing protein [Lentisphaerota bacterium]WET07340.1 CYTH domain-containing protein [Lentisphaerota bacterium ZTH]
MGKEIERKYLVNGNEWRNQFESREEICQGYIARSGSCVVRVRVASEKAMITVKGEAINITRSEFEYPIPREDALKMLLEFSADNLIEKKRYFVNFGGNEWVIDEYFGRNAGLVVAEIEIPDEATEFAVPEWIGKEVSTDFKYSNASLATNPYRDWKDDDE